jgi:hypothetical protein
MVPPDACPGGFGTADKGNQEYSQHGNRSNTKEHSQKNPWYLHLASFDVGSSAEWLRVGGLLDAY